MLVGRQRMVLLLVVAACLGACDEADEPTPPDPAGLPFLSVSGEQLADESGREVRLRGIWVGWGSARGDLPPELEDAIPDSFQDAMLDHALVSDDLELLRSMGANSIRLSINTYRDLEIDSQPYTYREPNFAKLDSIIDAAEQAGLYVILSMRQSPGGHNTSEHSGSHGANELWGNTEYQQRLVSLWARIAERYADRSVIAGHDLLNEPDAPTPEALNAVYDAIADAIRQHDERHVIFLEGNRWAIDLDWVAAPLAANTALSTHFYVPGSYAVEGNGSYPGDIGGQWCDQDVLRVALQDRLEYGRSLGVLQWVGEFGAKSEAGGYLEYDGDLIDLFDEAAVPWTYFNFKNLKGFADTQAIFYLPSDSAFMQLSNRLASGTPFSAFSETEIQAALASIETRNCLRKQELWDLLSSRLLSY